MIDRAHALPISSQAKVLNVSRSSVYYLPRPVPLVDLAIMRRMDELHLEFPFAGSRMLRDLLNTEGIKIGRRHVSTLMNRMGIEALYRRPNTSKPAPGHKIYPYLLRNLAVTRPNQVWARLAKVPTAKPLECQTRGWTLPTFRWHVASSTSLRLSIGSAGAFWRGGCRSRWKPSSAWKP
jgi:putative transposase